MADRKVKVTLSVEGVKEYEQAMRRAAEATRELARAREEVPQYPEISRDIEIVSYGNGERRVFVNGQDITGWIAADSALDASLPGPNEEPRLTLTLTAPKLTQRNA